MKRILVLILGAVLSLSGCTMAPKYSRPKAPVPGLWPGGAVSAQPHPAAEAADITQLKWQDFFTDQRLKKIIKLALRNNRDLRLAALNVEKARALYGVQRAELLPTVNAQEGFAKQRSSADFTAKGSPNITQQYSADLGIAAWEIDFFGRIRSLKRQALEEYLSTDEARRSAQITLISEVARVYLTIAADRENWDLARSTLKAQEDAYNLILRKYRLNLVNEMDLRRAQTQVDQARGDIARFTQQAAQDQNALNLLAGSVVPDDLLPSALASVGAFKDISVGLPSEVLLKRPDIISAEHSLKGAYANIGAARAAFFPSISLTTLIGSASNEFSGLFKAGKGTWTYAPQVTMPIFDARVWFAYRVSDSTRKIALAQYEKAIQTAFREVADVLAVQGTVDQQIAAQQAIADSAQKIYELSSQRYAQGIDGYLSVLDAQRSLYGAQQGLISLQLSKLVNKVKTYAVLGGGGWEGTDKRAPDGRESFEEKVLSLLDLEFQKPKR